MMTSKTTLSRIGSSLLLIAAALSLFLAESAFWINHTVFDQATFTHITTTELLSDSSRNAIATAVVDKALADRPVAKRVVGDRAASLISGLLGTDASTQAVKTLSNKTYAYVTSPNRDDIAIDLTSLKTFLTTLITLAQSQGAGDRLEAAQAKIPDEIVLIESDSFPDLSGVVKTMLWFGPLLWLLTILLFAVYIYIGRAEYARRVYFVGATVALVAIFGLAAMPFIPPPLAAAVPSIELRPVAEGLATGFLTPFKHQMTQLLFWTAVVILIFNRRFALLRLSQTAAAKLSGSLGTHKSSSSAAEATTRQNQKKNKK